MRLSSRRFKRGLVTGKTKLRGGMLRSEDIPAYKSVQPRFGFAADVAALWTRTKFEYLTTVRSVPFIILASLAMALFAFLIIVTVFFSPQKLVPTSLFMVSIGFASFLIPVLLIIAFFSAEMVFRDRGANFTGLLDSTKVRNWSLLVAKWLALSAVLVTLCVLVMIVGMAIQIAAGGPPVNIALYLKFTFLNAFPNYLAFAFLGLFVQAFVPNRIVGMLVAAGAMAIVALLISNLPFYHPLMGFGGTSPGQVSEISPYNSWVYFRWFNFYWGALCILFAVLSVWLWRRGFQVSLLQRSQRNEDKHHSGSPARLPLWRSPLLSAAVFISIKPMTR